MQKLGGEHETDKREPDYVINEVEYRVNFRKRVGERIMSENGYGAETRKTTNNDFKNSMHNVPDPYKDCFGDKR